MNKKTMKGIALYNDLTRYCIDLAKAESEALVNILCSLLKQKKIKNKTFHAKRRRQREGPEKISRSNLPKRVLFYGVLK